MPVARLVPWGYSTVQVRISATSPVQTPPSPTIGQLSLMHWEQYFYYFYSKVIIVFKFSYHVVHTYYKILPWTIRNILQ